MENFALHMRISGVTITDDDMKSRSAAAISLSAKWGKETNPSRILEKAASVAEALGDDGNPSTELGEEIQAAIQKKSPAYLYEERPLEIGVCAGMAMTTILKNNSGTTGWLIADVYAFALWSALGFQPILDDSRRENLRREVLKVATDRAALITKDARVRLEVPDPSKLEISIDASSVATNNFEKSIHATIEALRRNAALDREEIDFLWWVQIDRSRILNRQLSTIDEPTRIVATGIEGAGMLRRLPCETHRELVLRTLEQNAEFDLAEMLTTIGEDRAVLGAPFSHRYVTSNPTIFPFLHALATGEVAGLGADVKRSVAEWGERALLEAGLFYMIFDGAGKI